MSITVQIHTSADYSADTLVETVPYGNEAVSRIDALAGRTIGGYIIGTAVRHGKRTRDRESAYVSASKGGAWYAQGMRGGFHVLVVRTPPKCPTPDPIA